MIVISSLPVTNTQFDNLIDLHNGNERLQKEEKNLFFFKNILVDKPIKTLQKFVQHFVHSYCVTTVDPDLWLLHLIVA